MFSITFKDPKQIKSVIETVHAVIQETVLKIDKDEGFIITAMDTSHICLVHLQIYPEDFEKFDVKETVEYGINLTDFTKIIKRCSNTDILSLSNLPTERKLVFIMKNKKKKKEKKMKMAVIDLDREDINLDGVLSSEYPNECFLNCSLLDEMIKDAEIFAEVLNISVKESDLYFTTDGNIGGLDCKIDSDGISNKEFTEETTGIFALSYLRNFIKASTFSPDAHIWLKSEGPLKIQFNITNKDEVDGVEQKNSYLLFFLAPRVEEDDDTIYED